MSNVSFLKSNLNSLIQGKNILILGFGREGQATYHLFRNNFPDLKITIADRNVSVKDNEIIKDDKNLAFRLGEDYLNFTDEYDFIIKTPGIPLSLLPIPSSQLTISSQTDMFFSLFSEQIIGITGTKGKSTTSSLIYEIIKSYTDNVILVGNIGIPPFNLIDKINKDTIIVNELSSHQLENVTSSPHISLMLNLYQEHLDYYKSYDDYKLAKLNIHLFQKHGDYFIFNSDNDEILNLLHNNLLPDTQSNISADKYTFSLNKIADNACYVKNNNIIFNENGKEFEVYDLKDKPALKGEHNLLNIMAAIIACHFVGVPFEIMCPVIKTFKGLKHRLEYVGMFDGIDYYNDSIATIPEATMQALKALNEVDSLILGGFDRGIDYSQLIEYLHNSTVRNIIFLGNAGLRIYNEFSILPTPNSQLSFYLVKDLPEAVSVAKTRTMKGRICLLSPAAASYDMFKNFEERGNAFISLVKNSS